MPKMGFFGFFRRFCPFWAISAFSAPWRPLPRGGFYINPSRRGPVTPKTGKNGKTPGIPQNRVFWEILEKIPLFAGFWRPGPEGPPDRPVPGRETPPRAPRGWPSSGGGSKREEPPRLICRRGGAQRRAWARVCPQGRVVYRTGMIGSAFEFSTKLYLVPV